MRIFDDEGKGVNHVYPNMIWTVMQEGELTGTDWHGAADKAPAHTRELHPATVIIRNPRRRLVTGRVINVTFALAEVLWILEGRDDVAMLEFYNSNIKSFTDDGVHFNAPYGYRMRKEDGIDQVGDVIKTLQADPNSRQATIFIGDRVKDRGWNPDGTRHETKDRACNVLAHLMIRGGKLDWMQIIRSNDSIWGTPYNWMQWTHIQEYIARCLGIEPGVYHHVVDSLHIYEHHFDEANHVRHDDLYALSGRDHPPFMPYNLQMLHKIEKDIRVNGFDRVPMNIPSCWQVAMGLFIAHALYRDHRDDECMAQLSVVANTDFIYAAAQARFYWTNRWSKLRSPSGSAAETRLRMSSLFGSKGAEWICA